MYSFFLIFFLIQSTVSVHIQKSNNWDNCGSSSDHLHNLTISYQPKIISKGDTLKLTITGDLDKDIDGGTVNYKVLIGGFPIYSGNMKICTELKCPLLKGPFKLSTSHEIPNQIFPGKYEIQTIGHDQNNQEIFCANVYIQVK